MPAGPIAWGRISIPKRNPSMWIKPHTLRISSGIRMLPKAHNQVDHHDLDGGHGDEGDQSRKHRPVVAESDVSSWNLCSAKQEAVDALVAANFHQFIDAVQHLPYECRSW
jgi:hypothetical protein